MGKSKAKALSRVFNQLDTIPYDPKEHKYVPNLINLC